MRRLGIVLAVIASVLVVVIVVAVGFGFWQVRRGYPDYDGQVALPGLTEEVEVVRNSYGVPTIYADTAEDLFRAQGYIHAQDRFFQMDLFRLTTAGRLSEIAGEDAIETDTFLRALGWRHLAEQEVELLSPQTLRYFEAYADGVNAWLDQTPSGERGVQYALFGLQGIDRDPEPWTVVDSLAFNRLFAWNLRNNPDLEAERAVLSSILPDERVEQLIPDFRFDEMGTILTEEDLEQSGLVGPGPVDESAAVPEGAVAAVASAARALNSVPGASSGGGVGSNSWAIAADRSASGGALLANDPHLGPLIPSLFTQMGLRCRSVDERCPFDVRGFAVPSVPGVVIGHNGHIAWGWTTPYVDTADLVLEKVEGDQYLTEDGMVPLETRTETLQVLGSDPVEVTIRSTRNGPLISSEDVSSGFGLPEIEQVGAVADVPPGSPDRGEGYAVALRWTGTQPGTTGEFVLALDQAATWDEFVATLDLMNGFNQNIVYADAEGNVGYHIWGDIPVREGYDGSAPVPGWTGEYEWSGRIPFEQNPHVYQPARGYVVTANEQPVPESYPYLITAEGNFSYRGDRIRAALEADADGTLDEAADLQMDTHNWLAERMVPTLLSIDDLDDVDAEAQALLDGWDFSQPVDSAPAAFFNAVYRNTLALTFHDEIPEEFWPRGTGRWFVVMDDLLAEPDDMYWDDVTTQDVEDRDTILRQAMVDARDELAESQGTNPADWEWGAMHTLDLIDSAVGESGIAPLEWLFNRTGYPAAGGGNIVLANSWDAAEDTYSLVNMPVIRQVVDFGDLDNSVWVNPPGQSGHPGHVNYDDQVASWQSGESLPMVWTDEAIAAETEHTLTLVPAGATDSPDES